jgi:hypothetical protein
LTISGRTGRYSVLGEGSPAMEATVIAHMTSIPRAEKLSIATKLHDNLRERRRRGSIEPELDGFIPELAALVDALGTHVNGHRLADTPGLTRAEAAEEDVDVLLRHVETFLAIEAQRRVGPNVTAAKSVYEAACPLGPLHVEERVVDVNTSCRRLLNVLKAPENAEAVVGIGLPPAWISRFERALDESDAALEALVKGRDERGAPLGSGRDTALIWLDLMTRLRRCVARWSTRAEGTRIGDGKILLKPLLDALVKRRVATAGRETRRAGKLGIPPASGSAPSSVPFLPSS